MKTLVLSATQQQTAVIAADIIKAGQLVAIPTETVYGLGADGLNEAAVARIFEVKGRPQDNPLILHVADPGDIEKFCHSIPDAAYRLAEKFWPGPLTMVLPAKDCVPKRTTAGLSTVAVRCPDNAVTREIIRLAGVPIAAPSANISGKPSTTTAQHVYHDHNGKIPAIVDGGPCRVGVESTIIDLSDGTPRLLRPGGITPEQLREVVGELLIDKAVTASVDTDAVVKAPGMKYKHYAPSCNVVIVDGDVPAAASYIGSLWQPGNRVLCFAEELPFFADFSPLAYGQEKDPDSLMAGLFAALRELDDPAIGTVFARCPKGSGKALAVQNRLEKAAGFQRIQPRKEHFIIGITGTTGSGKTTALNVLKGLGAMVYDCDKIYHKMLAGDRGLLDAIERRFPGTVEEGTLDRQKLGSLVFSDPQALLDLNAITHPRVKETVLGSFPAVPSLIVIDAIELFDGGLAELCHVTVSVTAPEEMRIDRLIARDNITRAQAENRIRAQKPDSYFAEKCDYVLENDTTAEAFLDKCLAFFQNLLIIKEKP